MSAQDSPLLELKGISKSFGSTVVVREIDLQVGQSEFICLLGASGCGKTTLLRIICGIESSDQGRVLYRGQDITAWSPAQRRFGIVFQSYALFPNLTVVNNITYGLTGMTRERQISRAHEMLELVGLAALGERYPAQLSGGQQQRIALARALAPSPSILLLDEPLSALDAQVRHTLRSELKRIQRELNIPVVMVTHDQQEAMELADTVMLMNQGQIEQRGTPRQLYGKPQSQHVAQFIGRTNILQATQELGDEASSQMRVGQALLHVDTEPAVRLNDSNQICLMIRPEHIQILSHARLLHEHDAPRNQYNAIVEDIVYSGASESIKIHVPYLNTSLSVECLVALEDSTGFAIGQACSVFLPPNRLHVLAR